MAHFAGCLPLCLPLRLPSCLPLHLPLCLYLCLGRWHTLYPRSYTEVARHLFDNMHFDHQPSFASTITLWKDALKVAKQKKLGLHWAGSNRFGSKFADEILHRLCSATANSQYGWLPALRWRCGDLFAPPLAQVHWCHPTASEQQQIDRRPRPGYSTEVPQPS